MDLALNPIMIKELRQVTRSRFLIGIIFLYMALMLAAVGFFILNLAVMRGADWSSGRQLFNILLPILAVSCIVFVPLYVGIRLAIEHSDTNIDLLFTTPLRPCEIVRGKLTNGVIMTLMLFSICTPYMVFTYLLRGIDIPTMFIVLVPLFLVTVLVIQMALFIAVLPVSKPFKGLLGIVAVGFMIFGLSGSTVLIFEVIRSGIAGVIDSWEFWGPWLSALTIGILIFALVHSFTIALIMPPSANRAFPVRLACGIAWLTVGIGLAVWAKATHTPKPLAAWVIPTVLGFALAFLFSIGETDKIRARVRQSIPNRMVLRPLAFLFYSGAAGGIFFCCLLVAITLTISLAAAKAIPVIATYAGHGNDTRQFWIRLVENFHGVFLYVLGYGFSAIAIRRFIFRDRIAPKFNGIIAIFTMMIGALVPSLTGVILTYDNMNIVTLGWWQLTNPASVMDTTFQNTSMIFAGIWAGIMFLIIAPWIFRQARDFISGRKRTE